MLVSIIMPVFNSIEFLRESIDSILCQMHQDLEFIILDDCSEEPVWDLINSYKDKRIVALRNSKNLGLTKSLNICLDKVKGDFVVRHDSDDISLPTRIEEQLEYFNEDVGFVGSWASGIDEEGSPIKSFVDTHCRCSDDDLRTAYPKALCMADPTTVYSIEAVRKVGYFDERMYLGQTYNYNRRVQRFFKGRVVPKVLYRRREHGEQVGKRFRKFIFKEKGVTIDWEALGNKLAKETPIIRSNKIEMNAGVHDVWVRRILSRMSPGLRILDAGAGTKKHKKFCSHLKYVSQDFCQYDGKGDGTGLQRGKKEALNIDIVSDIVNIPEPDSSFDIILCNGVFEHIPDPIAAIKEFSRLLKSDGFLILTAPFCSMTHYAPYHFYSGFNRYFYEKYLPENGFKIVSLEANGSFFEFLMQELVRVKKMAIKYTDTQLNSLEETDISNVLDLLTTLHEKDKGSHEFLCFGYFVLAKKTSNEIERWKRDGGKKLEYIFEDINSESIVFDVGMWKGLWTHGISEKYNPFIFGFEPVESFYKIVKERFKLNSKIKVYNYGLGDKDRQDTMIVDKDSSSLFRIGNNTECVEIKDVSEIFTSLGLKKIDLLALNCEGSEYEILLRLISTGLINKIEKLLIQFHFIRDKDQILRENLIKELTKTHTSKYCYFGVWELWQRNYDL